MTLRDDFDRVSRSQPCPICRRPDWCMVSKARPGDPEAALCQRVESPDRWGDAGWFHRLRDGDQAWRRSIGTTLEEAPEDHRREAERLARGADLAGVADSLGLPIRVLERLLVGVGEDRFGAFSSWPQVDPENRVVGISLRRPDGAKRLRRGDRAGLHVPTDLPDDLAGERVLVVEGGSDCAAGLALGRWTIGRPSVLAQFREIRRLLTRRRPGLVSVVADRDEHEAGIRGARQLARCLESVAPDVLVVEPPAGIKDLRSWLHRGLEERELRRVEEASR